MSEIIENQNNPSVEHGGGPRTPEGKAISRYNAQKHSILRETLTDYEKADGDQIYNDLADDFKPRGRFEELLVELVASNMIRLQRIAKAESELIKESIAPPTLRTRIPLKEYEAQVGSPTTEKLLTYSRYQTAAENRIYRALAVLKQIEIDGQNKS